MRPPAELLMVHDDVWAQAELDQGDWICMADLPTRLGRKLHGGDFTDAPANEWVRELLEKNGSV